MSPTAIHVTLIHEGGAVDVAAPPGVSVDDLLAFHDFLPAAHTTTVSTPTGRRIGKDGQLGREVPEGAVLVIADAPSATGYAAGRTLPAPRTAYRQALRAPFWLAEVMALLLAILLLTLVCSAAITGAPTLPMPARATIALTLLALLIVVAVRRRTFHTPTVASVFTLSLPLLGAAIGALMVPPTHQDSELLAALIALWSAAATAMALWLRSRGPGDAVGAAAWACGAAVVTVAIALGMSGTVLALLVVAFAVLCGTLIPAVALASVPDRQLLDMTGQRAAGKSVRIPITTPPVRVTRARTLRTVNEAGAVSVALELVLGSLVVICFPAVVRVATGQGLEAWGARLEMVFALGVLMLRPRTARSHATRVIPRLSACTAVCISALTAAATGDVAPWLMASILFAAAVASIAVGGFTLLRRSAWWGSLGDVFEWISALLVLPAAVIGSGLIEVMRQL